MSLRFDPSQIEQFKADLRQIPGYPIGEELPIREMLFESGALLRLPEMLSLAGAAPDRPLLVVMDRTPMRRAGADLKPLILTQLREAGWRPEPLWLEPDATGQVHTDFAQIGRVQAQIQPGMAVLSVGAGTVTDVAKHACHEYARGERPPRRPSWSTRLPTASAPTPRIWRRCLSAASSARCPRATPMCWSATWRRCATRRPR